MNATAARPTTSAGYARELHLAPGERCYYALRARFGGSETESVRLFKVSAGSGRWEGRVFVELHNGDGSRDRLATNGQLWVLHKVAEDPKAALKLYAEHTGSCGRCGIELTHPVSIERGYGPVCAGRMGL